MSALKIVIFVLMALAVLPLVGIIWNAFGDSSDVWPHLVAHVLPQSLLTTFYLLLGVGALIFMFGVTTAWLVSRYDFPLKRVFEWALILPLAIPTYISAYVYVEFLDFTGPVQSLLRSLFGFQSSQDYWFPDIRSTGGAMLLLSLVLFPYVYLPARLSFQMQSTHILDVARVLGASPLKLFTHIAVPVARPAIVVGISLALMETLNDIGAVEYLGVRTLTLSIYETWLNRSSLAGAAQISLSLLAIIILIIYVERRMRAQKGFQDSKSGGALAIPTQLFGAKAFAASLWCFVPILLGFLIPLGQIIHSTWLSPEILFSDNLKDAVVNCVLVAFITAIICVFCAFIFVYPSRSYPQKSMSWAKHISSLGYAIPGTILGLGVLYMFSGFDNLLDNFFETQFGISTGLLFSGSMFILIYAYSVRFLTISIGTVEAGYEKISRNLSDASRALGRSEFQTVRQIELPLMKRAFFTAGLLVGVETIKELPATLLLRPFDFNTLATIIYEHASRAAFDDVAAVALVIVLAGLIPVYILTKLIVSRQNSLN